MGSIEQWVFRVIEWGALLFITVFGLSVLLLLVVYLVDRYQTKHSIRRNYPVIGRFRYWFEHLGEFFRQYFFAMDREELPFNRAERAWVYRAAKNVDSTVAFGSTRPLNQPGSVIFVNCSFPTLTEDAAAVSPITLGAGRARFPYTTSALFHISGMSFGAISVPAIRALTRGARKAGIWLNTGEGGLSSYHLEAGCDLVFQLGTAKYGVRDAQGLLSDARLVEIAAHESVRMFEIKLSQGAKPGKGGILPGAKVTAEIAQIRGIPEGQDSISPNGHPDIRSVAQLLDMVARIRLVTGKPVGIKLVVGQIEFFSELFEQIHHRGLGSAPDFLTLDSADGGTGAAPQSLMDYVGLPIQESLPLVVDKLNEYDLRGHIRVVASGKLITPAQVAWALCMGADFVVSARGFMFALGCIQSLQCNKNTCPTGITTHNPSLQRGLDVQDKTERVYFYAHNMEHEVGILAHSCGVKEPRQLQRSHVRLVVSPGRSEAYSRLFPESH